MARPSLCIGYACHSSVDVSFMRSLVGFTLHDDVRVDEQQPLMVFREARSEKLPFEYRSPGS